MKKRVLLFLTIALISSVVFVMLCGCSPTQIQPISKTNFLSELTEKTKTLVDYNIDFNLKKQMKLKLKNDTSNTTYYEKYYEIKNAKIKKHAESELANNTNVYQVLIEGNILQKNSVDEQMQTTAFKQYNKISQKKFYTYVDDELKNTQRYDDIDCIYMNLKSGVLLPQNYYAEKFIEQTLAYEYWTGEKSHIAQYYKTMPNQSTVWGKLGAVKNLFWEKLGFGIIGTIKDYVVQTAEFSSKVNQKGYILEQNVAMKLIVNSANWNSDVVEGEITFDLNIKYNDLGKSVSISI